ncbi:MAG: hypothetical protein ACXVI9_07830 [Mucilaginibacter sp.]
MLIAYSFINSSSTQYKTTAKIALRNISTDSAARNIKSKYLVEKTLDKLHYQVSYYDSAEPNKEISGDKLPIQLLFNPADKIKQEVSLSLRVTGTETFELNHVDTVLSRRFNEPVDEYYGRFSVVHTTGEKYRHASCIIKLHNPEKLVSQYFNSLDVKVSGDKTLTLEVSAADPEKSAAFLDKLIALYGIGTVVINKELPDKSAGNSSKQIELLIRKADSIKSRIVKLSAINKAPQASHVVKPVDSKQLKIYRVIKPYVEAPARQFVQIPYTEEVNDLRLRKLLDQYNVLELKKQHILADKRNDSAIILQADNDLATYRNAIIPVLDQDKQNPTSNFNNREIEDSLKALRFSLAMVRSDMQTLKKEHLTTAYTGLPGKAGIVVLENPKDNIETLSLNPFWVYMLAVIAGLLIPIVWWVIREPKGNILPSNLFNQQKLIERINDLFAVKQID